MNISTTFTGVVFAIVLGLMSGTTIGQVPDSEKASVLQKATEAFEAAQSVRSGAGKGTYRYLERDSNRKWTVSTDAKVETFFEQEKYKITLAYRVEPMKRTKRVIVYDTTAILTTRFGQIRPAGGETQVLPVPSHRLGLVRPQLADFPWDVSRLPTTIENMTRLRKSVGDKNMTVVRGSAGTYELSFLVPQGAKASIEISPAAGYNVIRRSLYVGSPAKIYQEFKATWRNSDDGIWYVDSLSEELHLKSREGRWELKYEEFTPNVSVEPKMFTLAALDMPPGSRILDHRPAVPKEERARWVPNDDSVIEKSLDGMLAQVQALPKNRPSRFPTEDRWILRTVFFAINICALVLLIWYMLYRRKSRFVTLRNP